MTDVQVIDILFDTLVVVGKVALPLLGASLLIGVAISVLQTVTQIQEMTLTFVPKLLASAVIIVVGGSWMLSELVGWVKSLWVVIGTL